MHQANSVEETLFMTTRWTHTNDRTAMPIGSALGFVCVVPAASDRRSART